MLVSPGRAYRGCILRGKPQIMQKGVSCWQTVVKKQHRVQTFKNDPAEIISVSTAFLGRMRREVIFTRHSIAIIIHFSLETKKKIKRTTDTYLCLPVSSLWTNLASSRMCDWNRNSLPLFGGRSKLYHPCNSPSKNYPRKYLRSTMESAVPALTIIDIAYLWLV